MDKSIDMLNIAIRKGQEKTERLEALNVDMSIITHHTIRLAQTIRIRDALISGNFTSVINTLN